MTMNQQLDRKAVLRAIEDSFGVGDAEDAELVRDSYSGRGMYGATCFGVVGSHKEFLKFVAALAYSEVLDLDELDELIDVAQFDNMGLDTIMYFPGWELES